jgi:hypothetical protein
MTLSAEIAVKSIPHRRVIIKYSPDLTEAGGGEVAP